MTERENIHVMAGNIAFEDRDSRHRLRGMMDVAVLGPCEIAHDDSAAGHEFDA